MCCIVVFDKWLANYFIAEVLPLSLYVLFIYFAFCDGFGLKPIRKIIWAVYFVSLSYSSFQALGSFDLGSILGLSSLLAFALAWFQVQDNKSRNIK